MTQEVLEKIVIELLLGYGDVLSIKLLEQLKHIEVKKRDFTALGFFTYFSLVGNKESLIVSKVSKHYEGLSIGFKNSLETLSFVLYIENGEINCLEAYTTYDKWSAEAIEDLDMKSICGGGKSSFLEFP